MSKRDVLESESANFPALCPRQDVSLRLEDVPGHRLTAALLPSPEEFKRRLEEIQSDRSAIGDRLLKALRQDIIAAIARVNQPQQPEEFSLAKAEASAGGFFAQAGVMRLSLSRDGRGLTPDQFWEAQRLFAEKERVIGRLKEIYDELFNEVTGLRAEEEMADYTLAECEELARKLSLKIEKMHKKKSAFKSIFPFWS